MLLWAFCCRSFEASAESCAPAESPRDLDALLTHGAAARGAGRCPSPAVIASFDGVVARFEHPTQRRKAILFRTLFAELGHVAPPADLPSRADAGAPEHHLWTKLMLTAVRVLVASRSARSEEIEAGEIDLLLAHQSADGSWEQHLLLTIVALLALHAAGCGGAAFERGLAELIESVRPDGGVPFITDEDTWMTCLTGYVLAEAGFGAHARMHAAARYLADRQNADGGWAYAHGVVQADADDTALAVMFLHAHDPETFAHAIDRGAEFLLGLRGVDGGVPTFVRGADPDVEITAKALRALHAARRLDDVDVRRSVAWIAARQAADGSFRTEWKLGPTYPIFHVLAALDDVGVRDPIAAGVRDRALGYLRRHQRDDGGWNMLPGDPQGHVTSTAYAVAALAHAPLGDTRALERGVAFLLARQQLDGGFVAEPDSLGPRPLIYDVPALATVYAVWALSCAGRALAARSAGLAPCTPALRRAVGGR